MKQECEIISKELTALAMGESIQIQEHELREHLAKCPRCAEAYEGTKKLLLLAQSSPKLTMSRALHERILSSVKQESLNVVLSPVDKVRLVAGLMAHKVRHSSKARFFLIAAAAQIIIGLSIYFTYDLTVQSTRIVDEFASSDGKNELETPFEKDYSGLIFPEDEERNRDEPWRTDPPSLLLKAPGNDLALNEEELIQLQEEKEEFIRKVRMENRLELSRYRMCARISNRCRPEILKGRGGDRKTEYAVERGLKWLRAHQLDDGAWPPGVYGGDVDATVGITALSVTAFLADGHSQTNGRYKQVVNRGINYLIACQDKDGFFSRFEDRPELMLFNQSASVLALAENFILSDQTQKEALEKGVKGLISLIDPEDDPDKTFSNTWAAMALRTSALTGVQVAGLTDTMHRVEQRVALLAQQQEAPIAMEINASYPPYYSASLKAIQAIYKEEEKKPDPNTIAFPDINKKSTLFAFLDDPDFREPSFLFFIGSALCEYGGDTWEQWNSQMKGVLLEEQQKDGMWAANGDWPLIDGGDLYSTALNLLTLQVYYRYIKLEENCN